MGEGSSEGCVEAGGEGQGDVRAGGRADGRTEGQLPSGEKDIREKIEALRLVLLSGRGAWAGKGSHRMGPGCGRHGDGTVPAGDFDQNGQAGEIHNAREISGDHGKCLLIERDIGEIMGADALGGERLLGAYRRLLPQGTAGEPGDTQGERAPGDADKPPRAGVVFLDLETTGLSATPLFLAGMLVHHGGGLRAVQILARDYSEERCLIDLLDGMLADCGLCVTFNGKSFDLPYLRERAKYHRLQLRAGPEHFDLLHHARRRWKHRLPDCRLLTLEWFILGRRRMGDVDGWEVPCIYHEFVHTKDARRLKQVLRHNLMDVLSMAELMVSLAEA